MRIKRLYPNFLRPSVKINYSKSWTNRALICGAQSKKKIEILNTSDSTDTLNLTKALIDIGLNIEKKANILTIYNSFPQCEVKNKTANKIYCGDGGTTTRFLTSLLSLGDNNYTLITNQRMMSRPMEGLFSALKNLEVKIDSKNLSIQGPLKKKNIVIDCSETSQFYSSLLLVLEEKLIQPKNLIYSKPYVELTKHIKNIFTTNSKIDIPIDWSSASFLICYAAITRETLFSNIFSIDKFQSDSRILEHLNLMGGRFDLNQNGLRVFKSELNGITIDCSDHPDLVPALVFICSYANGNSRLLNLKNLKFKESDRIEQILKTLKSFSVKYNYNESQDYLEICGPSPKVSFISRQLPPDHRIIFLNSLFMFYNNGGELDNSHTVNKSFSDFYKSFEGL